MDRIINSPWGKVQSQHQHAPGIMFVSTSGHGGYRLSEHRQQGFKERMPDYFARLSVDGGCQWFEEDCGFAAVYLCWPEYCTDEQIEAAVRTVRVTANFANSSVEWTQVSLWIQEHPLILDRAKAHLEATKHLWERGGMSSMVPDNVDDENWSVYFRRGDVRRTVCMPYPQKRYYSDEELDELEATPVPLDPVQRVRDAIENGTALHDLEQQMDAEDNS